MKSDYILLIAGSRRFDGYDIFHKTMGVVLARWGTPGAIVSGGASGVDSMAKKYAEEMNYKFTEYPADWKLYGRRAGPIRNTVMVGLADKLVAFVDEQSVGTWDTIRKAKAFPGMDVLVFKVTEIKK